MTDLKEVDYFIHHYLVIFFLLLNKLVSLVCRKGVKENQVALLFTNGQFMVSLEVVIQLEEEASFESLQGHFVWLLQGPL